MLREMKNNEKGFTLVELIVVVAIMAVLGTLLIPRIMGNVEEARKQRAITTARTIASEITLYNATAISKSQTPIKNKTQVAETDLTSDLKLPAGTSFPDPTVVTITVDSNGNAFINIKS